ncbi:MAG: class II SORL domain-containing protein [Chloroflexota bacterium]|nr:class II SORL domain-containing protein [Chloroflexota bacterium]
MSKLSETIQSADWKKEKHAPTITAPNTVKAGEVFEVKVGVGDEIAHPNTLEHHIGWITLYFQPEGGKFPYQVGHFEFSGHGAGDTFTNPSASVSLKVDKPGTLQAVSFCNLHGLWENTKEIGIG